MKTVIPITGRESTTMPLASQMLDQALQLKKNTNLFTPRRGSESTRRIYIQISDDDLYRVKMARANGDWDSVLQVTAIPSGDKYLIKLDECALPGCHCDAYVVSRTVIVKTGGEK